MLVAQMGTGFCCSCARGAADCPSDDAISCNAMCRCSQSSSHSMLLSAEQSGVGPAARCERGRQARPEAHQGASGVHVKVAAPQISVILCCSIHRQSATASPGHLSCPIDVFPLSRSISSHMLFCWHAARQSGQILSCTRQTQLQSVWTCRRSRRRRIQARRSSPTLQESADADDTAHAGTAHKV